MKESYYYKNLDYKTDCQDIIVGGYLNYSSKNNFIKSQNYIENL